MSDAQIQATGGDEKIKDVINKVSEVSERRSGANVKEASTL